MTEQISVPLREQRRSAIFQEFRASWRIAFAALIGMTFGVQGLSFYSFGVFVDPLAQSFHWSLSRVTAWVIFWSLGITVAQPIVGILADRFGARKMVLLSLPLLALALTAVTAVDDQPWLFYAAALGVGFLGTGASLLTFGRVVNVWFKAGRGTALGVMAAGNGVAAIFGPRLMQATVDAYGWRIGFLVMAAGALVIMPIMAMWIWERRDVPAAQPTHGVEAGYSLGEAVRLPLFWMMSAAFLLSSLALGANVVFVPFLTSTGISRAEAATYVGLLGIFSMSGKIIIGFMIDALHAASVYAIALVAQAVAFAALALLPGEYAALPISIIGFAIGGEAACGSYCIARYFGVRSYGGLFGLLGIAIGTGIGLGPVIFTHLREVTGSYQTPFLTYAVIILVSSALFALIARRPFLQTT